jgi:hypothetical protein
LGVVAGLAILIGAALPWTTAGWLEGVKTRTGTIAPAVVETAAAGLVVLLVAGARAAGRRGTGSSALGAVTVAVASGVVVMGVTDLLVVTDLTRGSSTSPWNLGVGWWVLFAVAPVLWAYAVAVVGRGRRLLLVGLLVVVVAISLFLGLVAGDAAHRQSYNYSWLDGAGAVR